MKIEASRNRAPVNAKVRKWALEAVMGPKKAAHAYLKGSETINTPVMLGEGGETLFDPNASVKLRAVEWDRIWQRDKAELPRLYSALHACRTEAAKAEHARPPISDGALARAVALLRNKRGIGTNHWTPLELEALPEVAKRAAFIVRQIDVRLTIPLQCLTNHICLLPKPGGGERPTVLQSLRWAGALAKRRIVANSILAGNMFSNAYARNMLYEILEEVHRAVPLVRVDQHMDDLAQCAVGRQTAVTKQMVEAAEISTFCLWQTDPGHLAQIDDLLLGCQDRTSTSKGSTGTWDPLRRHEKHPRHGSRHRRRCKTCCWGW